MLDELSVKESLESLDERLSTVESKLDELTADLKELVAAVTGLGEFEEYEMTQEQIDILFGSMRH